MESQTSQQTVIESQKLQQLQDDIQQEMHEILKNTNFSKILKNYGISRQEVLQFQYTLDLTKLQSSDVGEDEQVAKFSLVIPGKHIRLSGCTCWSNDINDFVNCPCH
ncbi:hypothetical protein [Nostoc sp. 'Peltigera malacea cyanobiont' DB3992]|uniref:hypothetical protein n=1 Tax=Nostoc sp. 'Peltigera malacea cyanobiont' DB3992 TaxID=1206980 RepID=UPI000C047511|nr:hypothetical protein [Nostoc sp. 'Peltigera malacea cyanobiont' DB3992]PHM09868.1 hypothetical protein CK516_12020 [Nostoc sp. 'Peltigera malacea cyanobiont' DB3992]